MFHSVLVIKMPLKKLFDNAENITPGIGNSKPTFLFLFVFWL